MSYINKEWVQYQFICVCYSHWTGITTRYSDREQNVNGSATFTCTSSVSTGVTFSWTRNGRTINRPTTQSTTGGTSTLTIDNIMNRDQGTYICTVMSGSLSVTSYIGALIVKGIVILKIKFLDLKIYK